MLWSGPLTAHLAPRGLYSRSSATRELRIHKSCLGSERGKVLGTLCKTGCGIEADVGREFSLWGEMGGVLVRNATDLSMPGSLGPAPPSGLAGCQHRREWIPGNTSNVKTVSVAGNHER